MNYTDQIKQLIISTIKTNNNEEITGQNLQEILISMLNIAEELYLLIESIEEAGVALLQSLGDSETMGISQKVITQYINSLQTQIDNAGKVDDVRVNGESIVDENKIANLNLPKVISVDNEILVI